VNSTHAEASARPTSAVAVQLEGAFDAAAAAIVRGRLAALPPDAEIVLDFGRVRDLSDLGLAALAHALAGRNPSRVRIRGLGRHHERLLRYLNLGS
jgi:anti-anti-sigma regulatory factor